MYRGRCGAFAPESLGAGHTAEEALHQHLSEWMADLVAGADLSRTSIARRYPDHVFKHFQYAGGLSESSAGFTADDFHSPVQPDRYISLRIRPMMLFYQSRIPRYTRSGTLMLAAIGVFSLAASSLAYLGFADFVVLISAAGAAITSYLEFADTQRKIERYTRAVRSIQKILSWWTTLDSVERAGAAAISKLMSAGEAIIAEERLAWQPLNIGSRPSKENEDISNQEGKGKGKGKIHPTVGGETH